MFACCWSSRRNLLLASGVGDMNDSNMLLSDDDLSINIFFVDEGDDSHIEYLVPRYTIKYILSVSSMYGIIMPLTDSLPRIFVEIIYRMVRYQGKERRLEIYV